MNRKVEAVGNGVSTVTENQRVIAFPASGSYAEYVVVNENLVFPIPDSISLEQAIASPVVAFTAYMALKQVANVSEKEIVVVHGALGGLGSKYSANCEKLKYNSHWNSTT